MDIREIKLKVPRLLKIFKKLTFAFLLLILFVFVLLVIAAPYNADLKKYRISPTPFAPKSSDGYVFSGLVQGDPQLNGAIVVSADGKTRKAYANESFTFAKSPYKNEVDWREKPKLEEEFSQIIRRSDVDAVSLGLSDGNDNFLFYRFPAIYSDQYLYNENRVVEIWKFNRSAKNPSLLLSTKQYDTCSTLVYWRSENHEILTAINLPVSSETYTKGFCILDDVSGRIKTQVIIPGYTSRDYYGNLVDPEKNIIILSRYSYGPKGGYLVNLDTKSVKNIAIPNFTNFDVGEYIKDGEVLLAKPDTREYVIFNMRDESFGEIFNIPTSSEKSTISVSDVLISHDYSEIAFIEYFGRESDMCYWIFTLSDYSLKTKICNEEIQGDDFHLVGWVIPSE